MAFENVFPTTLCTARSRGIHVRASDSRASTGSNLIFTASSGHRGVVSVRLAFAPEKVIVVAVFVDGGRLGVVIPGWLILYVTRGGFGDGEGFRAESDLVDVVPV